MSHQGPEQHSGEGVSIDENDIVAGQAVTAKGIRWDTDDDDTDDDDAADTAGDTELPDEVRIVTPDDWELGDTIADLLTDRYGFCIHSIGALETTAA